MKPTKQTVGERIKSRRIELGWTQDVLARGKREGFRVNLIEAYDQPWKTFEGGVGPYWGMLNAAREPKFSWTGPIVNPDYWKLASNARLREVIIAARSDEAHHGDLNHGFADQLAAGAGGQAPGKRPDR